MRICIAALGFVALLAACGDDDDDASTTTSESSTTSTDSTTTTTSSTSTTSPEQLIEAEVTAAYEAAQRAFIDAAAIPDPDFPALLATYMDPALNQSRGVLTQLKFENRVIRYPQNPQFSTEVEGFELQSPDVAVLTVCIVDDGERYDSTTGALLTDGQPGTSLWTAALRRAESTWRVAEQVQEQVWEGVAGCAVD